MQPVTLAEFGRIKGVSLEAVRKAISSGRLVNSIVHGVGKKPKLDPVVAAQEWERNTDHSKRTVGSDLRPVQRATAFQKPDVPRPDQRPASGGPSINDSRAILEAYKARLAKIEYEEKIAKLVDAEAVKADAFKLARSVRDNMLNIPDRVSAEFAGISNAAEIHMRLTDEIRKALEALIDDYTNTD
jgi:phage terminase Nu1 subunit (DNA packaging protein)